AGAGSSRGPASRHTLPPPPPSPPEGPPRATRVSPRKGMHPLPPSPAFTRTWASSTNTKNLLLRKDTTAVRATPLRAAMRPERKEDRLKPAPAHGLDQLAVADDVVCSAGSTLMKRPSRPLSSNLTSPVTSANTVSSLHPATFNRGLDFV